MTPLEIANYKALIDGVVAASKKLLDGNADAIFDGVHDPVGLWFNCGQAKAVIGLYENGAIDASQCASIINIFDAKYRVDIQNIYNNYEEVQNGNN